RFWIYLLVFAVALWLNGTRAVMLATILSGGMLLLFQARTRHPVHALLTLGMMVIFSSQIFYEKSVKDEILLDTVSQAAEAEKLKSENVILPDLGIVTEVIEENPALKEYLASNYYRTALMWQGLLAISMHP